MYNGGISNFCALLFMKDRVDVGQNLQGLSYEVSSTNIARIFRDQIIYSSFRDMRHYTPGACCYVTRIYEIRLYKYWGGINLKLSGFRTQCKLGFKTLHLRQFATDFYK